MVHYYLENSNGLRVTESFDTLHEALSELCERILTSSQPIRVISERVVREEVAVFSPLKFKK